VVSRGVQLCRVFYATVKSAPTLLQDILFNWLMLFREIIAVYSTHHTKQGNTLREKNAELLTVKVCGIHSYHI
jgi:hypothetical protein